MGLFELWVGRKAVKLAHACSGSGQNRQGGTLGLGFLCPKRTLGKFPRHDEELRTGEQCRPVLIECLMCVQSGRRVKMKSFEMWQGMEQVEVSDGGRDNVMPGCFGGPQPLVTQCQS